MNTKPLLIAFHFPHKSASMFAYKILSKLQVCTGYPLFSQNNRPPNQDLVCEHVISEVAGHALRGPVRNFSVIQRESTMIDIDYRFSTPEWILDNVEYRAICQTRDILDLCVSQYFSHGRIHPPKDKFYEIRKDIQAGKISVYDYVLLELEGESSFGQDSIVKKYHDLTELKSILPAGNFLHLEYEEMMLNYDNWAMKIELFLPEINCAGSVLEDLRPEYNQEYHAEGEFFENPLNYVEKYQNEFRHVRSPYPGDHTRFLTPGQISELRHRIAQEVPHYLLRGAGR